MSEITQHPSKMLVPGIFGVPGDIRVVEVDVPELAPDGILVKVEACGLCSSEIKATQSVHPNLKHLPPPLILGHEFSGTVIEKGELVTEVNTGERYVVMGLISCGYCRQCRKGRFEICENFGRSMLTPGGFAPYVQARGPDMKRRLYPIPAGLSFEHAALAEPLACVLTGIERARIDSGDVVVVLGAGFMGLLLIAMARARGADRVISVDQFPKRLEIALRIGATDTVNLRETDSIQAVRELTNGQNADVVIEATGNPKAYEDAFMMIAKGGRILYFGGTPPGSLIQLDAQKIHYSEIEITGSANYKPVHVERAIQILASHRMDVDCLISHRMSSLELKKAVELSLSKESIKIMFINE